MCGIAGSYGIKTNDLLDRMSKAMLHRGPDGEGRYVNDTVSLLNRRLAIIDRSGGDQPIFNENESLIVVFNGEIYNFRDLRAKLIKAGHVFKTQSDTEVIVHGFEEWSTDVFDKFNGMFTIALYDKNENTLYLVRDQFGIKPLYYFETSEPQGILFASEIKPLLESARIEPTVNERILYRYLKYRIHDDERDTFFKDIKRLLPGELMVVREKSKDLVRYSSLEKHLLKNKIKEELDEEKIFQTYNELQEKAVKLRLLSEVPVGSALSGGIDSSAIVSLVNKNLHNEDAKSVGDKQNTFSAVFPNSENDEEIFVDELLKNIKDIQSHKIFPKSGEFFADIKEFIKTQEEPTISTGPYAQFQVMRQAKNYVTVLLDGQGLDEMMAGYLPYHFVYFNQLYKQKKIITLLSETWRAKDIILKYGVLKLQQIFSSSHQISPERVLKEDFIEKYKDEEFSTEKNNLKKRLYDDIFKNSLQSLLRYEDRNTMHFSLEGRVPFLDKDLVSFIFSLPDHFIIRNGWNKFLLRTSMKGLLPDMIRWRRKKIGFTTPEHQWFLEQKQEIYKIFLSESFASRPYWSSEQVLKNFRLFLQGRNDDTMLFWRLLNTEMWLREFIDTDESIEKKEKETMAKEFGTPNAGKKIEIQIRKDTFYRIPIRTKRFSKGDNFATKIAEHIHDAVHQLTAAQQKDLRTKPWYVVSSEKIVAISQGRSFFIWDINPSWWANTLSSFVSRTPYGIGLGSPWTMQIAIDEVGLPRILLAAVASVLTKPLGIRGVFYRVAGPQAAAIDGPTEYSLYPSNVSAKLAPKDPKNGAKQIAKAIREVLKDKDSAEQFAGAVIIDANDIGRNIMGNATDKPDAFFEEVMRDNPMGQGSEQTPLVIVV